MKSIKGKVTKLFMLAATLFVAGTVGLEEASATGDVATPISGTVWAARTVDQVKADISGNEYTIVWGDTLSVISEATNISIGRLAEWNNISNVDLIFAGNKLVFDGNVVSLQDSSGNTISQAIVNDQDKNDPTKPIGGGSNTSNNGNGSGNNTNPTTPPANGDNGSGSDNGTTTPPTGGDNGQSTDREITVTVVGENAMFTRFRVGPFNDTDEASQWVRENYPNGIKGYEVHPDGDYIYIEFEIAKEDQVTPPGGGDNGSGGSETTPPTDGGGDNGSGGGETDADTPVNLGNSGIFKPTVAEANAAAYALWAEDKFVEFTRFDVYPALNSKGEQIGYTVNFF